MFTPETSDIGIFVNAAEDTVLPTMALACDIAEVVYKCEFDENCKDGDNAPSTATNSHAFLFAGTVLCSLMVVGANFFCCKLAYHTSKASS